MLGLTPSEATRALRPHHRLRRAARVRGPQAQELLLGHARAARVLGDDPGRRRHPADRRGARRRRRRVPAEVLRRVQPPARRGPHDPARHARHGRGQPLLRPRDAARARRGRHDRRARARSRARVLRAELRPRPRSRREAPAGERHEAATARVEIADAWFEDKEGQLRQHRRSRASASVRRGRALRARRTRTPCSSFSLANDEDDDRLRDLVDVGGGAHGLVRGRRARRLPRLVRQPLRARAATTRRRRSRATARATTCTCASTDMATLVVTGARAGGGMVDVPHKVRIERAEVPAT